MSGNIIPIILEPNIFIPYTVECDHQITTNNYYQRLNDPAKTPQFSYKVPEEQVHLTFWGDMQFFFGIFLPSLPPLCLSRAAPAFHVRPTSQHHPRQTRAHRAATRPIPPARITARARRPRSRRRLLKTLTHLCHFLPFPFPFASLPLPLEDDGLVGPRLAAPRSPDLVAPIRRGRLRPT